jgi:hypothetical protein
MLAADSDEETDAMPEDYLIALLSGSEEDIFTKILNAIYFNWL